MNVLLLCNGTDGTDGWSTYSLNLKKTLEENGHMVHTVQLGNPVSFVTNPLIPLLYAFKIKKYLKKCSPDIVHISVEPYALTMPFLGKAVSKKTVLTVHGSYGVRPLLNAMSKISARYYYNNCGGFIAVSNYTKTRVAEELVTQCGKNISERFLQKTKVIHNCITLPEWQEQKKENAEKQIICVGGVKPRKGILEALDACYAYKVKYDTPFHFAIIGSYDDDTYTERALRKIYDLKLQDHVTLTGNVSAERLEQYYKQADVFLMPAKTTPDTFEGFGLVYIEANSYGIPSIGPNDSGAAEAIEEGVSGYRVDPSNSEAIAEKMHQILNRGKIQPLSCREWAEKHDQKHAYKSIQSIYAMLHSAS